MIRNLKRITELHNRVIHGSAAISMKAVNAEEGHIQEIAYNELNLVCKKCFNDPS